MSTRQHDSREHASNFFKKCTTVSSNGRIPLGSKSINLSQLMDDKQHYSAKTHRQQKVGSNAFFSSLTVEPKNRRQEAELVTVADFLASDRIFRYARYEGHRRARKQLRPELLKCQGLVNRVLRNVHALDTTLKLQRNGAIPVSYDKLIQVRCVKRLSSTETLAVSESGNVRLVVLHGSTKLANHESRGCVPILINTKSSVSLYPGLMWCLEWRLGA
ncbi:LADA_0E03928g1_1 [Lachancea dasiensis]|uniref:LADA_0E03928g1_1 n=1 Tax=Lachancea dasiensis TaxID=1072105 RepID=A0A1G4JBF9_9SACH|nr:LADA_0E03928g1_1 [Lachancea dasiensis]